MSDSEVDEYLRLPEGYESRRKCYFPGSRSRRILIVGAFVRAASSPEPERTRELELSTVYRQKITTTTKTDVAQKLKGRYLVADASVQTSASDGAKKPDMIPVESHLEVSLERFEAVLLSGKRSSPDLDEAVDSVLQNPNFQGWMENYFRDVESDSVDEHAPAPESDAAEDLMKAFNMIMGSHAESDDTRPYNLRFLLENHFVERPEPHELPQAAAILDSGSDGPWDWSDIAIFVEFGAVEFESQLEELSRQIPASKTAETEYRTPTATLDPGPTRQWSPSRKRDVSPSASIDDPCPPKRPRRQSTRAERSGDAPPHFSEVNKTSAAASPKHKPPAELARCALEVFHSRGNRRHVLGLSLAHRGARFWYFDRAGSIRTPQLTLSQRPFVRALMKFAFCGAAQLGLEDVFVPPGGNPSPPIFNTVEGWMIQVQGSTFTINEALHSAEELYGRGTAVFSVTSRAAEEPSGPYPLPRNVVLKLSWQLTSWHDEDALYRLAAEHDVEGISRLYRSAPLSRLSHGFRGRLVDRTHFFDRELRAQVLGPLCVPLYRVKSLDDFKKAFIALVKGMHPHELFWPILRSFQLIVNFMSEPVYCTMILASIISWLTLMITRLAFLSTLISPSGSRMVNANSRLNLCQLVPWHSEPSISCGRVNLCMSFTIVMT